jgi:hypothetical protein
MARTTQPTGSTVLDAMKMSGLDPAAPGLAKEAALLASAMVKSFSGDPNAAFVATTSASSPRSPGGVSVTFLPASMTPRPATTLGWLSGQAAETAVAAGVYGVMVLIWLAGVIWGARRRARWVRGA